MRLVIAGERLAQGGRCSEQVQQNPAKTPDIASEPQVLSGSEFLLGAFVTKQLCVRRPKLLWQRIIEVHARDRLHVAAVAMAQSATVDCFHLTDV